MLYCAVGSARYRFEFVSEFFAHLLHGEDTTLPITTAHWVGIIILQQYPNIPVTMIQTWWKRHASVSRNPRAHHPSRDHRNLARWCCDPEQGGLNSAVVFFWLAKLAVRRFVGQNGIPHWRKNRQIPRENVRSFGVSGSSSH